MSECSEELASILVSEMMRPVAAAAAISLLKAESVAKPCDKYTGSDFSVGNLISEQSLSSSTIHKLIKQKFQRGTKLKTNVE